MTALLTAAAWQASLDRVRARYPVRTITAQSHHWEVMDSRVGGRSVMVLPGGLARADAAFRWVDRLTPQVRVVAVAYPTTLFTIEALCHSFWALCDQLHLSIDLLSGGSYSGLVAQCLIRDAPQCIPAMVLSDTGVPRRTRAGWLAPLQPLLRALPLSLVRDLFRLGAHAFTRQMEPERGRFWRAYFDASIAQMPRAAYLSLLSIWLDVDRRGSATAEEPFKWAGRLLLINAARDRLFPIADQRALHARYPQAVIHDVGGHSHAASLDLLDETISAVLHWWGHP